MRDPRPGFERIDPRRGPWRFTFRMLVTGLVLGMAFVLVPAEQRDHVLGRTEHVSAAVTDVRMENACDTGERAVYTLAWADDDGVVHESVLRRCGPQRRDVGDEVEVWVAPGSDWVGEDSPNTVMLWVVGGLAVFTVMWGWLAVGRVRLMDWAVARGERRRALRARG